jgi:hypothetical protein
LIACPAALPRPRLNHRERPNTPLRLAVTEQPEQQRFTLRTRARTGNARSIFLLRTRAGNRGLRELEHDPRLDPPGATTFPRIWNRSINACKNDVKGKSQNIVAFFDSMSICSGALSFRAEQMACRKIGLSSIARKNLSAWKFSAEKV